MFRLHRVRSRAASTLRDDIDVIISIKRAYDKAFSAFDAYAFYLTKISSLYKILKYRIKKTIVIGKELLTIMKALNYISQEISKGKNLSPNLSKYGTSMASMYNTLAYIKLSMNYYTVYDCQLEESCKDSVYEKYLTELHGLIGDLLSDNLKGTEKISALRDELTGVMEVVTSYVDRLRIYEYVLNRVEYRFKGGEFDDEYYNTYLTNDLIHYILSDKDNVVIHSKISEVVEQLPMRLSRSKFYEYLSDAFSLYHGAQKGTVDDFVYALETSAMIRTPEGFDTMFPEMGELLKLLENADYSSLDNASYNNLRNALDIAAEKMTVCADSFVLLTQLVNDLYTIVLTQEVSLTDVAENMTAREIIGAVSAAYKDGVKAVDDSVLERFTEFEGKQERILMNVSANDFAIDYAVANYAEKLADMKLTEMYAALVLVTKLQSGSNFVTLSTDEDKLVIPPDSYADMACEKLIDELNNLFKTVSIQVRRAVMSAILSQLPVFFNNTEEIQHYINMSLMQCNDDAEKSAVVEVLKMIMSDDN